MKERMWIKIDGLQLHHLQRLVPMKGESIEDKKVWASLKLGETFDINGLIITTRTDDTVHFMQGFGNADARLIDVPALHEEPITVRGKLLEDVLAKAIHDFCLQRTEVLRPFIENGEPKDILTFDSFKPEDWQGKSLEIPVDFIRLKNFQRLNYGNIVATDIQIGHHLIFWGVRVWNTSKDWHPLEGFSDAPLGVERIQERELNRLISRMFLRPDVKDVATLVANGAIDMDSKFVDKVKGCDPEAMPPSIRFQ